MFKKTALFIYLFKEKKLEKLLEEQFIEQIGIIETIGEMYLDKETEFQLNYLLEKDIPLFLNNYVQSKELSFKEMENNLSKQATAIKEIFFSIYLSSSKLLKKDMDIQLKVLSNRNKNIQKNLNTYQQIQSNCLTENNITTISLSELEDFKTKGLKILQENNKTANWQNGFKSASDIIIDKSINPIKQKEIITADIEAENIYVVNKKNSYNFPFLHILFIVFLLSILATVFMIVLSQ